MYHHDKRQAQAMVGHALEARGWNILGYKPDRSDLQSDYWDPESWDGIATFGEYIACVGVGEYEVDSRSGRAIEKLIPQKGPDCERCKGTGEDPSGWTLERAKAEPRKFHLEHLLAEHHGSKALPDTGGFMGVGVRKADGCEMRVMHPDVVSPLLFHAGSGALHCVKCKGQAHRWNEPKVEVLGHWPVFQANPKGTNWHLERAGKILAKGIGFSTVLKALGNSNKQDDKVVAGDVIASKIHAAMEADQNRKGHAPKETTPMKIEGNVAEPEVANAPGFTVRNGTREGFVEILFDAKPDAATIAELKAAKFRFSFGGGEPRWYGPEANLPERYRDHVIGQRPADPEPAPEKDPEPDGGEVSPNAEADETNEPEAETEEGQDGTDKEEGETDDAEAETADPKDASLLPIESLRCNPHIFDGQKCGKDSAFITDGYLLMVKKFVTTKFKTKHAMHKSSESCPVPDNSCERIVRNAEAESTEPTRFLGYTARWEDVLKEKVKSRTIGILRNATGFVAVDAERYKLIVKHVNFDAIRTHPKNDKALAFYKGETIAALLMPIYATIDKRKVEKFLKDAAVASATPPKAKAPAPEPTVEVQVVTVNEAAPHGKVTPLPLPVSASLAIIRAALARTKAHA